MDDLLDYLIVTVAAILFCVAVAVLFFYLAGLNEGSKIMCGGI